LYIELFLSLRYLLLFSSVEKKTLMENRVQVGNKNYSLEEFSRGLISNCDLSESCAPKVQQYLYKISGGYNNNQSCSPKIERGIIERALKDWQLKLFRLTLFALAAVFSQVTQAMLETRDMTGNQIIDYPIVWTNFLNDFFLATSDIYQLLYYILFPFYGFLYVGTSLSCYIWKE